MPPKTGRGRPSKATTTTSAPTSPRASRAGPSSSQAQEEENTSSSITSPRSPTTARKTKPKSPTATKTAPKTTNRVSKRPAGKGPRASNIQRKLPNPLPLVAHTNYIQPATQRPPANAAATNPAPSRSKKSANTNAPSTC